MTKERLEQLRYIEKSLKSIREDIADLNKRIASSTGRTFTDMAKGSMPEHPYIERHYEIQGVDYSGYERLRKRLCAREDELQDKLAELEEWLGGIKDERLYLIFRLKYRNGMTNAEIGKEVGYTGARVSQLISNYLR